MPSRGRPPTPTVLRVLQGNPHKKPFNRDDVMQPRITDDVPAPPIFVVSHAADEWWRIAPELHAMGLLTVADIAPLAAYCMAYQRWRDAEEALEAMRKRDPVTFGILIKTQAKEAAINPLFFAARVAAREMVRYAIEFGFTPSARARIAAGVAQKDAPKSKFGNLLA